MSTTLVIRTARLVLRPLTPDDAEAVVQGIANPNVVRTLTRPPWPYGRQHADAFIAYASATAASALIAAITRNDNLIGIVSIEPLERGPTLGYWLAEPYWGRGYMSEAARAIVGRFFATRSEDIASGFLFGNPASWRVQEKLGFVKVAEGVVRSLPRAADLPHVETRLTRERFKALDA